MTRELLQSEPLRTLLGDMTPPLRVGDVVKLAVGRGKASDLEFTDWEAILSEIIVGDAFGVDRMDYLLRDSHHAGVVYGRFDHIRLIDSLRILHAPGMDAETLPEPQLGIEAGGLHTAEALLLARYFMYSQVYFHSVRMVYDLHLIDFLGAWLPGGVLPIDVDTHLRLTDNEASAAMLQALLDEASPGHGHAERLLARKHFRVLYRSTSADLDVNPNAAGAVYEAAKAKFGEDLTKHDRRFDSGGSVDFPVLQHDGRIVSSTSVSVPLRNLPPISADYVFLAPEKVKDGREWLDRKRDEVIRPKEGS